MKQLLQIFIRWLLLIALGSMLTACAVAGQEVINHSFEFDLRYDNQDAVVLDYRYGNSKLPVSAPKDAVKAGKEFYVTAVGGPMLRGEFLYVKWRNKVTGQIYEDTVDLRHRLPQEIKGTTVYFMIRGPQLYVYLILPERRTPDVPPNGPHMYRFYKVVTIYPDQPKQ